MERCMAGSRSRSTSTDASSPRPKLIERVTGGPLRIEPYMRYLRTKYGELYTL